MTSLLEDMIKVGFFKDTHQEFELELSDGRTIKIIGDDKSGLAQCPFHEEDITSNLVVEYGRDFSTYECKICGAKGTMKTNRKLWDLTSQRDNTE